MAYEDLKQNPNYFKGKEIIIKEIIPYTFRQFKFFLRNEQDIKFLCLFEDETLKKIKKIFIMQKDWGNIQNGYNGLEYFNEDQLQFIEMTISKKYRLKNIFQQEVRKS